MTPAALNSTPKAPLTGHGALAAAARFWWGAAVIGQAMFLTYIVAVYVPATLTGNFARWPSMIKGYIPGDTVGNLAVGFHMMVAAIVTFGGTLQLLPQIRARAPVVHRWIGRTFLVSAIAAALGGLWMVWVRDATLSPANSYAISGNALLILTFGAMAWRQAARGVFASHRRWAMRTFIVANGVWFLRVGAIGVGASLTGLGIKLDQAAFFNIMVFASYLVPLAILELYLRAQAGGGRRSRRLMAAGLTFATLVMSVGIVGAWFVIFAPEIAKL